MTSYIDDNKNLLKFILNKRFFNDWAKGNSSNGISLVFSNDCCTIPSKYKDTYFSYIKKIIDWIETNNFYIPYIFINTLIDNEVYKLYNNICSNNIGKYIFVSESINNNYGNCIFIKPTNSLNCSMMDDLVISIPDFKLCVCQGLNINQLVYGELIIDTNDLVPLNISVYLKSLVNFPSGFTKCCYCSKSSQCKGQILCKNLEQNGDPFIINDTYCLKRR